jgi:large subunit ribosomal protein L4
MEAVVFDQKWKEVGTIALNESVFGLEPNGGLVHRALVYQQANARYVVAHTLTRGERRGSNRKLYKQKGTGRARVGDARSPIRKKGWVAFGPRNTVNFSIEMNKKERRKALCCVLSTKAKGNHLIVVDDINLKEIKTKAMVTIFQALKLDTTALFALNTKNEVLEKSTRNIPTVKPILVDYLNVADLLKFKKLVLLKSSVEKLNALAK